MPAHGALRLPLPELALESHELKLGLATQYIKTGTNFDANGDTSSLANSGSFQSIQGGLFGQFGLSDQVTAFATLPAVFNSVTGRGSSTTGTISTTGSGMGEATFGLRYQPYREPVRLVLEASGDIPLYSRLAGDNWARLDANSTAPLGTGSTAFTLLSRIEMPFGSDLYGGASLGFTSRSGGFSNLMPYSAYLRYDDVRSVFFKFGLSGNFTVSDDQYAGFTQGTYPNARATNVSAGSLIYNAVNPTYTAAEAHVGVYIIKQLFVAGGIEYPFRGKSYPTAPTFMLALGTDLGGTTKTSGYTHSNRGFQEYYLPSKVIKANNKLRQVLIDRGKNDGVRVGELLDLFEKDRDDGSFGETVARGRVLEVGPTRAKIQVLEYFKEIPLQEGFVVRRPVR